MPPTPRRLNAALLATGAVLLAGCGSTVQFGAGISAGNMGSEGLPSTQSGAATSSVGSGMTSPQNVRAIDAGGQSTSPPLTTSTPSSTPTISATDPLAPGVSRSTIKIGYVYSSTASGVAGTFGIGIDNVDEPAMENAVADDINKRGGILGHKVVLVGYDQDAAQALNNPDAAAAQQCIAFTQDTLVFAVLTGFNDGLAQCLTKKGVMLIESGGLVSGETQSKYLYFAPSGVVDDSLEPGWAARMAATDYLTGWDAGVGAPSKTAKVKFGMIVVDQPRLRHKAALIRGELAKRGYLIDDANVVITADNVTAVGAASQNAVLKFRGSGVTHVLGSALLFWEAAQNQGYHPRYNFDGLVPLALAASTAPKGQLHGSQAIGWLPTQDVDNAQDPGAVSAAQKRCVAIMKAARQDLSSRTTLFVALTKCEDLWTMEHVGALARVLTVPAVANAFGRLGAQPSTLTFDSRWSKDRRGSARVLADLTYNDACSCYSYGKARTTF